MHHSSLLLPPPDAVELTGFAALDGMREGALPWGAGSAVDAFRQSRWRLERVADTSPIIYLFALAPNRNVYSNRAVATVLGHAPDLVRRMTDAKIHWTGCASADATATRERGSMPSGAEHLGAIG